MRPAGVEPVDWADAGGGGGGDRRGGRTSSSRCRRTAAGDPVLARHGDGAGGGAGAVGRLSLDDGGLWRPAGRLGGRDERARAGATSAGAGGWRRRRRGWRAGCRCDVFRLAGIYGPGRSAFDKLREGRAQRVVKPGQVFSRIHVDDIAAALRRRRWRGRTPGRAYNVADDEPAPPQDGDRLRRRSSSAMPVPPEVRLRGGGALADGAELLGRVEAGVEPADQGGARGDARLARLPRRPPRRSSRRGAEGPVQQPRRKSAADSRFRAGNRPAASAKRFGKVGIRRPMGAVEVGGMHARSACAREWPCWRWRRRRRRPGHHRAGAGGAPPRPSLNLYGVTGLIDMPSAEAQPDAQVSASYSQFGNTPRRNFTFQLLPRVSATLRYSTIQRLGHRRRGSRTTISSTAASTCQFQLLKEKGWRPSVALGFRDFLGTGVYSGRVSRRDQDRRAGLHGHRRHRLGAARQRRRGREPVLLDRRQLLHPRDRLRRGRQVDVRRAASTARRWASSAASSGGRRSTS